jgi:hypothetical protein
MNFFEPTGGKLRNVRIEAPTGALALSSAFGPLAVSDVEVATGAGTVPGSGGVMLGTPGTTIDRLVTTGPAPVALTSFFPGLPGGQPIVVRRSNISGGALGLQMGSNAVVTDTVVRATGATAPTAIVATGGKLRNVTAIASGTGARGLQVVAALPPALVPGSVSAKNSIFRGEGGTADVVVDAPMPPLVDPAICITMPTFPGCPGPGGDLTITNSNFRNSMGTLGAGSGSNQSGDPLFVDADAGNYRLQSGSPAIDTGADDGDNGPTDLDGKQRKLGSGVDMGAFEFDPPLPPISTPGGNNTPQPDVVLPVDGIAPALSRLGITNKTFAVGPQATPVAARAKKGTTFVYTLSEPATVAVTIEQAQSGRRKGSSCVKQTSKNRKAKKCTRYVRQGAISRAGIAGPNALPFSGRIGKKALKPGSYRAVIVAADSAGNRSSAKSIAFKIVKK